MRTLVVAAGAAVLAVVLAASATQAPSASPEAGARPVIKAATGSQARTDTRTDIRTDTRTNVRVDVRTDARIEVRTDSQLADSASARDRSPAQCLTVRVRSGRVVLRLQDPQSGVRGFRGTPFANTVLTPSGKSLPRPVAQSDVGVSWPMRWIQGGAVISHVNGAGIVGSCVVASTADGSVSILAWP